MVHTREYVEGIVNQHNQIGETCVPSSVEIILKLLGRVPSTYYDLQNDPNNRSFADFDERNIMGVNFKRINLAERGPNFPFTQLFQIIDRELDADRYVVFASLGWYNGRRLYHAYVIFGKNQTNDDYYSVTKATALNGNSLTQFDEHVKARIIESQGTDILVY